eukprot:368087-Amphidinium_carterae.1
MRDTDWAKIQGTFFKVLRCVAGAEHGQVNAHLTNADVLELVGCCSLQVAVDRRRLGLYCKVLCMEGDALQGVRDEENAEDGWLHA